MRYTVTKQLVQIIGFIWQPGVGICASQVSLDLDWMIAQGYDPMSREDVERWVLLHHTGDYSAVIDMRADLHVGEANVIHEWASEESEIAFSDAMYPSED